MQRCLAAAERLSFGCRVAVCACLFLKRLRAQVVLLCHRFEPYPETTSPNLIDETSDVRAVESLVQDTGESRDTMEPAVSVEPPVSAPRDSTNILGAQVDESEDSRRRFRTESLSMTIGEVRRKTEVTVRRHDKESIQLFNKE